jgi:hypothetical protein
MSFEEATARMFAAIHARDMDGLSRALRARAAAIEAGFEPTIKAIEEGERALRALKELKKGLAIQSARLRQLEAGVASTIAPRRRPRVDCKG